MLRFVALIVVERVLKLLTEIFDKAATLVLRLERPGAVLLRYTEDDNVLKLALIESTSANVVLVIVL